MTGEDIWTIVDVVMGIVCAGFAILLIGFMIADSENVRLMPLIGLGTCTLASCLSGYKIYFRIRD